MVGKTRKKLHDAILKILLCLPKNRLCSSPLCSLVFVGLLARICEMAVLVRWAEAHWEQLRDPLGFIPKLIKNSSCIDFQNVLS